MEQSIFIAVLALIQVTMGMRPIFHRRLVGDDDPVSGHVSDNDAAYQDLQTTLQQMRISLLTMQFSDDFKTFKRQYDTYPMQLQDIPNDYCKTNFIDVFESLKDGKKTQDPQLHARYQQLVSLGGDHIENLMQLGLKDCQENLERRLTAKGLTWAEKPKLISLYSDFFVQHTDSYKIYKKQFETYPMLVQMANMDTYDDIDDNDNELEMNCYKFVHMYEIMLGGMVAVYDQPKTSENEKARKALSIMMRQSEIEDLKSIIDDGISDTKARDDMLQGMDDCNKNLRSQMEAIGLRWVECNPSCSKTKTTKVGRSKGWSCC